MRLAVLIVLGSLIVSGCDNGNEGAFPGSALAIGELLPPILVYDLEGDELSVPVERGRITVLNLWASWCAPCRKELPSLQRLSEKLDPERFIVVGVSVDDDPHLVREYLLDIDVSFQNYLDLAGQQSKKHWGPKAFPLTYIIGVDGRVLRDFVGEREWDSRELVAVLERGFDDPGLFNNNELFNALGMGENLRSGAVMAP